MKRLNTSYLWALGFSIFLFMLGQVLFVKTFKFFEPHVDGILFQITEHRSALITSLLFSMSLFLIPILIVLTWRLAHITSLTEKVISVLMILTFVVIGIFARHQQVKIYFTSVVRPALLTNGRRSINYPIDPVNFVYYIFAGLIIGCMVCYILFKKKEVKP